MPASFLPTPRQLRTPLRWMATALFVGVGVDHFINAPFFRRIVPPSLPMPGVLVAVSGVCEIAGGLGLLFRPLRRAAGWGLIALLIAVFPANIYMAVAPDQASDLKLPGWVLWLRLPLQAVFIAWVWFVSLGSLAEKPAPPLGSHE